MYCRPDAKHEHENAAIKQAPYTAIVGVGNPGGCCRGLQGCEILNGCCVCFLKEGGEFKEEEQCRHYAIWNTSDAEKSL